MVGFWYCACHSLRMYGLEPALISVRLGKRILQDRPRKGDDGSNIYIATPRLRWADAHHRDLPVRPKTAIPRPAQKGHRMMRRTSSITNHSLNCIAFRAGSGLPIGKLAAINSINTAAKVCHEKRSVASNRQEYQKPCGVATQGRKARLRFPHSARPDPAASS